MEKKKLLLVAISVGVFLMIVVGASLLIFSGNDSVAKSRDLPPVISSGVDPQTLRDTEQTTPPETVADTMPDTELQLFVSEADVPVKPAESAPATITVPAPRGTAIPDTPKAQSPAAQARPAPRQEAPRAAVQPRPAPAPVAAARPSTPRTETKSNSDYWIQTGAFTTQIRAEGAKESLADKGITSVIDNSSVNGRTWYRVRVGPYISENEANY
jgi:DedD protein